MDGKPDRVSRKVEKAIGVAKPWTAGDPTPKTLPPRRLTREEFERRMDETNQK